jgi:hypothetical protein
MEDEVPGSLDHQATDRGVDVQNDLLGDDHDCVPAWNLPSPGGGVAPVSGTLA